MVIGAEETVRVRYRHDQPEVESERRKTPRTSPTSGAKGGVARAPKSGQGKRLSAEKRKLREQRQRAVRVRRALFGMGVVALVALVVWGATSLVNASAFSVRRIEVKGAEHISAAAVRRLTGITPKTTLLNLSKGAVRRRVLASPWIADVRVDRDFPHNVVIEVTERVPVAIVDAGGKNMWVVSSDGMWLGPRSAEVTGIPVVTDLARQQPKPGERIASPELRNVVRIAGSLSPELRAMTRTISAPSIEKTALITVDDVEVYIGEATDMAKKDRIAREILQKEKGRVVYVNVRVVDSPTWRGLEP